MGTSGAYGGSGTVAWVAVEGLLDGLASGEHGSTSAGGQSDGDDSEPSLQDELLTAIGDALLADDPKLSVLRPSTPVLPSGSSGLEIGRMLPAGRQRGGTGGSRAGRASRRDVVAGASRAGRALGAAYALQRGDAAQLATFGLVLADLVGRSRVEQILAIVNTLEDSTSGPDDQALRNAVVRQLNRVLSDGQSDPVDALRDLIVGYCIDLAYVEIEAMAARVDLTHDELLEVELQVRALAEAKASRLELSSASLLRPAQFQDAAEKIVRAVVAVIRTVLT